MTASTPEEPSTGNSTDWGSIHGAASAMYLR
jgi:hypothetical protein